MKTQLNKLALIALVSLAFPTFGHAETKKTEAAATTAEAKPKKATYPLYGVVVSISDKELVIKGGKGKEDHHYTITKDTKFVNHPKGGDKKEAKASDVKVGAEVGGLLKKVEKGEPEVESINVGVKQKDDKKPDAPAETPKKKTTKTT